MSAVTFVPLLSIYLIALLAAGASISALLRWKQSRWGAIIRLLAIGLAVLFLLGPQWRQIEGDELADIAVIFEDKSRSLDFGGRRTIVERTADRLEQSLLEEEFEVRRVSFGTVAKTDLAEALNQGLADIPRRRLSAVTVITDGQVHGDLETARQRVDVPVHALVTGDIGNETDRRIEVVSAPRFGVVGEKVDLVFKTLSPGESGVLPATLYVDGKEYLQTELIIGDEVTLSVPLTKPGDRLLELEVEAAPDELTQLNNRAVTALTAVRDRLRVLLVSGEPHAGERVWRNILKSDPAVDLIHFTILKPGEKLKVARDDELNLIEFPHEELFLDKLSEFDVLIFDRYTYRGVLLSIEFEEIARYVERGGAVLIAAGPEFSESGSLASRPNLEYILPAVPRGPATTDGFLPQQSETGLRHPVTRGLGNPEEWGRWFRALPSRVRRGDVLMTAGDDSPLLVVDQVRDGRIAMLLSDHVWLWARGFDGGGPHQELLRRLVHWLMQEPELDDEALTANITQDGMMIINRQSLQDEIALVEVTDPNGDTESVMLSATGAGTFSANIRADTPGLYRLQTQGPEGDVLFALAASGEERIAEIDDVLTMTEKISPLSDATGGGVFTLTNSESRLPTIRRTSLGRDAAGGGWAGFPERKSQDITAIRIVPLFNPWLALGLIGGLLVVAWLIEGQIWRRRS